MPNAIVVGVQWGDEGKGKMVDLLSERAQHIVRSQGGNNAGHTIVANGIEYRFHLIPSGIIHPNVRCYITGGVAIDPAVLLKEIEDLEKQGVKVRGRLFISPYAHVILPFHRDLDKLYESRKGSMAIGTTGRGIGPCYSDRASRTGIRIGEMIQKNVLEKHLHNALKLKNEELQGIFHHSPLDFASIFAQYSSYGAALSSFVDDAEWLISEAIRKKEVVLFEGAHGTFLDVTFGTYPFVTSSSTIAAGVCAGAGIGPSKIDHTLGVVKAYTTRVGNGPLPTALTVKEEEHFLSHHDAREIGTTTGRKRRMGWFDAVLVRRAISLNGVDSLAVTKLDVLDSLKEIKICKGYRVNNVILDRPPSLTEDWEKIEPVYETLPGWHSSTKNVSKLEDLPKNARLYLDRLVELCEVPISIISLGPERESTIFLRKIL